MFQEIEYLEPLRKFLMSYPALSVYETLEIDYMAFDDITPGLPPGLGAIQLAGSNSVQFNQDILSNRTLSVQDNYLFLLRRRTGENTLRRGAGDFLRNYVRWINYENAVRNSNIRNPLLPEFSNFDNFEEMIAANGEMQMGIADDGADEFQIQLQVSYKLFYESEDY